MEHVLALYHRPHDLAEPVICFDERPCFLIGDTVVPLPMRRGAPKREHYEYEKLGSCVLMVAVDPKDGWRFARVYARRRKQEYAQFMNGLAEACAARAEAMGRPEIRRVHLVQDNLNTHHAGAFYENFGAARAHELEQLYQFHYTPKGGSWLNMAELELSAIARQCLARRIASQAVLEREVLALVEERNEKGVTLRWQFSVQDARQTFGKHYRAVHPDNAIYEKT